MKKFHPPASRGYYIDHAGQTFERLTVIAYTRKKRQSAQWLCSCACGRLIEVDGYHLRTGQTRSCGCLRSERTSERNRKSRVDLVGQTLGRLRVNAYAEHGFWACTCICGTQTIVHGSNLTRTGGTRSCGCLVRELSRIRATKHGLSKTPIYRVWLGMQDRCLNPNSHAYKDYGGRGIGIEFESVVELAAYMGQPPEGRSIDRIINDDGYRHGNLRWATRSEQRRNQRPRKKKLRIKANNPKILAGLQQLTESLARAGGRT